MCRILVFFCGYINTSLTGLSNFINSISTLIDSVLPCHSFHFVYILSPFLPLMWKQKYVTSIMQTIRALLWFAMVCHRSFLPISTRVISMTRGQSWLDCPSVKSANHEQHGWTYVYNMQCTFITSKFIGLKSMENPIQSFSFIHYRQKCGILGKHNGNTRIRNFDLLEMAWHQPQTYIVTLLQL